MNLKINNRQSSNLKIKRTATKTTKKTSSRKRSSSTVFKRHTSLVNPHPTRISMGRGNRNSQKFEYNNKFLKFIFKFFSVACLVALLVVGFNNLKSRLYAYAIIDSIEIKGCNNVSQSEIMNILPFQVGQSLWQIDLGEAEKKLSDYKKELKNISMHKKWAWGLESSWWLWSNNNKIVVSLKERVPEVFIDVEDKKCGLDFDNIPFNLRGNMFSMKIPNLVFVNDTQREDLLTFFQQIKSQINNLVPEITEIKYGEVDDIVLTLNNKINIYWGLPKENKIKEKSYKLQKILDDLSNRTTNIDSIDLSFLDKNKDMIIVKKVVEEENKVKV